MMFFMWIIPLVLVAFLAYILLSNRPVSAIPVASSHICANCHQPVQNDRTTCPHCGQIL
jgi:hypothetical protein